MAIADTITSMQNHTSNAYTILNYATDLTGTNKNLANLKQCIFDSLINSMSDTLNTTWNNLPKITTTPSTSQSINNTIEAPMRVQLNASELEQFTTTGKNKMNLSNLSGTNPNGITYSVINNVFTLSGTNTSSSAYALASWSDNYTKAYFNSIFEKGKTFTLSTNNAINGLYFQINYFKEGSSSQSALQTYTLTNEKSTFTIPQDFDTTGNIFLGVFGTATSINGSFSLQLEEGGTKTSFEPYTAGASPNPNYPQDIHTISGDNKVVVNGKNFLSSIEQGTLDSSGQPTSSSTAIRSKNYDLVEPSTQYTFSMNGTSGGVNVAEYTSNKTFISYTFSGGTFTTSATTRYIKISKTGTTSDTYQIELGNQATTYTPYISQEADIDLGDIEYCKIGIYSDRIFKNVSGDTDYSSEREDGAWYIKKNIGKVVLDGTETNWNMYGSSGERKWYLGKAYFTNKDIPKPFTNNIDKSNRFQCSQYISGNWVNNKFGWHTSANSMIFDTDFGESLSDWTTWLTSNNIVVYYAYSSPIYTQITGTLAEQLEAIYNSMSKDGQTSISQINNDLSFILNTEALEDLS